MLSEAILQSSRRGEGWNLAADEELFAASYTRHNSPSPTALCSPELYYCHHEGGNHGVRQQILEGIFIATRIYPRCSSKSMASIPAAVLSPWHLSLPLLRLPAYTFTPPLPLLLQVTSTKQLSRITERFGTWG